MSFTSRLRSDGVAWVTYEGASGHPNHLGRDFPDALRKLVFDLERDPRVRGAVLRAGSGSLWLGGLAPRVLLDFVTVAEAEAFSRDASDATACLARSRKPVVAAIHGAALDAGLEIALACRARVATEDPVTRLGLRAVELGLSPCAGGLARFARLVGLERAATLATGGACVDAPSAHAMGLVDAVTSVPHLERDAAARVLELADLAPGRAARGGLLARVRPTSTLAHAYYWRRERRRIHAVAGLHHRAPLRVLELLRAFVEAGPAVAQRQEGRTFGELVVTSAAQRLLEVAVDLDSLRPERPPSARVAGLGALTGEVPDRPSVCTTRAPNAFVTRLVQAYSAEGAALVQEGSGPESVDRALEAWGFSVGPVALLATSGVPPRVRSERSREGAATAENMQMRCVLAVLEAAFRGLDEGLVARPRAGDVDAILGLGFPAFRGGPFRYAELLGADETRARMAAFGGRFAPPPGLEPFGSSGQKTSR